MKTPKLTAAQRNALSGAWSFEQAVLVMRQLRDEVGDAWEWFTPRVREALVAEKCFGVVRARHSAVVDVSDMDLLLNAMRVVAGLVEPNEVL
jgi:hypothetical protein